MVLVVLLVAIYAFMRVGRLEPRWALLATVLVFEGLVVASGSWHDQIALIKGLV